MASPRGEPPPQEVPSARPGEGLPGPGGAVGGRRGPGHGDENRGGVGMFGPVLTITGTKGNSMREQRVTMATIGFDDSLERTAADEELNYGNKHRLPNAHLVWPRRRPSSPATSGKRRRPSQKGATPYSSRRPRDPGRQKSPPEAAEVALQQVGEVPTSGGLRGTWTRN